MSAIEYQIDKYLLENDEDYQECTKCHYVTVEYCSKCSNCCDCCECVE